MDTLALVLTTVLEQLQKPTLSFLIGGMLLAALGSRLEVPEPVYRFIVMLLLLKVGLSGGIAVREAQLVDLILPALAAVALGIAIVLIGAVTLSRWRQVSLADGLATAGLFGAVSASTLAAWMAMLDDGGIAYEGYIGALYPFMDLAALLTAILLARVALARQAATAPNGAPGGAQGGTMALTGPSSGGPGFGPSFGAGLQPGLVKGILVDTLRSPAISALLLGLALGLFARPESVYGEFYEPLFRGLLSLLMFTMGMEAWSRLSELRKVAGVYVVYGLTAPLMHGLLGFAVGLALHHAAGFSAGGVVLLAVMAGSSSDISGPPTLRAALPEANPSAYVGTSTGLGTPIAILSIPIWIALADALIGL